MEKEEILVEKILLSLEENLMFDAAIHICRLFKFDNALIDYYYFLKGENREVDLDKLDLNRRKKILYIKSQKEKTEMSNSLVLISRNDIKENLNKGFIEFNKGNYKDAEKNFSDICDKCEGFEKVYSLTYMCICKYQMGEFVDSLRYINSAIDITPWDDKLKNIREAIIDRLSGVETKNKFIEDYYVKGTYIGELLKNSLQLYEKIDSIKIEDKNIFRKIKKYFKNIKVLFNEQKVRLEQDLINTNELILDAEKQYNCYLNDSEAKKFAKEIEKYNLNEDIEKVLRVAELLYYTRKKDIDVDYSYIIFSYCKAVEMLSREKLVKYFIENKSSLPPADNREDYLNIGIKSYDAGGVIRYSFKNEFDISSSDYLVEINKHRLLRKKYTGNEHIMPWDKLKFINHCIKTGKDPIDGTKSAGMLLLFYCAYKNFLNVQYENLSREDIIVLAGNLIRLQNERNNFMHSKILEQKDWLDEIRSLSFKCIESLSSIK